MHDTTKEVKSAAFLLQAFSLITGLAYPLFITGIVQTIIPERRAEA